MKLETVVLESGAFCCSAILHEVFAVIKKSLMCEIRRHRSGKTSPLDEFKSSIEAIESVNDGL